MNKNSRCTRYRVYHEVPVYSVWLGDYLASLNETVLEEWDLLLDLIDEI